MTEWHRLTGEPGRADGTAGMAWLPDGRIVYTSSASGPSQLWIVNADGSNAHQLTSTVPVALNPFPSADGRWIYFDTVVSTGRCIYRIAPDGSGIEQITHGGNETHPVVSPDGSTVFFSLRQGGENHAARVPSQGGDPTMIWKGTFSPTDISPDGTQLVGPTWSEQHHRSVSDSSRSLVVNRHCCRTFPVSNATFTPDGRALLFPDLRTRPFRMMRRPLPNGVATYVGPPLPAVTFSGALSRDGRLVISRGSQQSDAVLITAVRTAKPCLHCDGDGDRRYRNTSPTRNVIERYCIPPSRRSPVLRVAHQSRPPAAARSGGASFKGKVIVPDTNGCTRRSCLARPTDPEALSDRAGKPAAGEDADPRPLSKVLFTSVK